MTKSSGAPFTPAVGRSNKEIARALFVTVNTVEGHLARAYAKLGIRSRAQLAHRSGREAEPGNADPPSSPRGASAMTKASHDRGPCTIIWLQTTFGW